MADKTPPTMRGILAASRASGPATQYDLNPDGTIAQVTTRPARPPWQASRLTEEQRVRCLTKDGNWPADFPPAATIGLQPADNDPTGGWLRSLRVGLEDGEQVDDMLLTRARLHGMGLMQGHSASDPSDPIEA